MELFPKFIQHNAICDGFFDLPDIFQNLEPLRNTLFASDRLNEGWINTPEHGTIYSKDLLTRTALRIDAGIPCTPCSKREQLLLC